MFRLRHALPLLTLPLLAPTFSSGQAFAVGTIIAAGGGSEGDQGDTTAWSYKLYKKLIENGDINHDGQIKVAILSAATEDNWLPNYFLWLGATQAVNVKVATRNDANNTSVVSTVSSADIIFLKGGDQGEYYDKWNDTQLEVNIRAVTDAGGAIGGTSAGAMSLAQFCFSGSQDLISLDVLQDAQTPYLTDASDGGSGIHTNFLSMVPNVVIDTHYTTRARLGRMLGILGKAVQDNANTTILAVGIDERTGLAITGATAEVIGVGSVDFIQQTSSTVLVRDARHPLYYTNLRQDRLTEGWRYDLLKKTPDTANRPRTSLAVIYGGDSSSNKGPTTINGDSVGDEDHFGRTIDYAPFGYHTSAGTAKIYLRNTLGIVDAQNSDYRGAVQESMFRALYDYPSYTGFLVAYQGTLSRALGAADQIEFKRNVAQSGPEAASILIDGKTVSYIDLSPYASNVDTGRDSLHAAGLVNARVHILAETADRGATYNTVTHTVVGGPK